MEVAVSFGSGEAPTLSVRFTKLQTPQCRVFTLQSQRAHWHLAMFHISFHHSVQTHKNVTLSKVQWFNLPHPGMAGVSSGKAEGQVPTFYNGKKPVKIKKPFKISLDFKPNQE